MKNSSKKLNSGIMYSTNPDYEIPSESFSEQETLPMDKQKLIVQKSTKHRAGKVVTLILGFIGKEEDLETLSKTLKTKLGTGGSSKDGEIIIQGDVKEKANEILSKMGYKTKLGN